MDTELQIVFRNLDHSDALEELIREKAAKMEHYFPHIIDARVIVEIPHRSKHNDKTLHLTVEVNIPGQRLAVSREPGDQERHLNNPHTVVNDSFAAMYKQLKNHARQMRGDVKQHDIEPQGRVIRKFPEQDYGFVRMADGQEIYFHRNAVIDPDFDHLDIDQPVRVVIAKDEGAMGPQASVIEAIGEMQFVESRPPGA